MTTCLRGVVDRQKEEGEDYDDDYDDNGKDESAVAKEGTIACRMCLQE